MDKQRIIECLQYAQAHLNDVTVSTRYDMENLSEAYIYISEALDLLQDDGKEAAQ